MTTEFCWEEWYYFDFVDAIEAEAVEFFGVDPETLTHCPPGVDDLIFSECK